MELKSLVFFWIPLILLALVEGKFKPEVKWFGRPDWANYDLFEVSSTHIKIAWQVPKNSGFHIYSTEISWCTRNDAAVLASDLVFYPMNMNHSYFNETFLQTSTYWDNCQTFGINTQTTFNFTSLTPSKTYKFRVRILSTTVAGNTPWTNWRMIVTRQEAKYEKNEFAQIYARGVGARNHNASIVTLDTTVILNHTLFRGLYLAVFDRFTLKKVYSNFYDTQKKQAVVTISTNPFTQYSVDADSLALSSSSSTSVSYSNPNEFPIAHSLARKIKEYDNKYIIAIVSQNAWELNFSKELGDVLLQCGAFNIMEIMNHYSPRFGEKTRIRNLNDKDPYTHTNFYHPYAFVGIPGLPPGKGFESLRSNTGFHMSKGNYAYAEVRVSLRWNKHANIYTFDTHQFMPESHFMDTFEYINEAKDFSLFSTFPLMILKNMTAYDHWQTSIWLPDDNNIYYTNATGYYTKADTVYLQPGEYPYKMDFRLGLNSGTNLVWVDKKSYYSYVKNFLYTDEDKECDPPYNDFENNLHCYNFTIVEDNPPEILKCYTGLITYYCPDLTQTIQNSFAGYLSIEEQVGDYVPDPTPTPTPDPTPTPTVTPDPTPTPDTSGGTTP